MKGLRFFAAMLAAAALAPFMHGQDAAETASAAVPETAAVPVEKAAAEVPAESEPAPEAEKAPEALPAASDASNASAVPAAPAAVPAAEPSDGELTDQLLYNQKNPEIRGTSFFSYRSIGYNGRDSVPEIFFRASLYAPEITNCDV